MCEFIFRSHRIANKEHQCFWCLATIKKGERYLNEIYKADSVYSLKRCDRCAVYVKEMFDCFCRDDFAGQCNFADYMFENHPKTAKEWWN